MFKTLVFLFLFAVPEDVAAVTVRVDYKDGGVTQHGSGTIIKVGKDKCYVLSCSHVISRNDTTGTGQTFIRLQDARTYPATVLGFDKLRDLCLLESAFKVDVQPAKLAGEEAKENDAVILSGFPNVGPHSLRLGQVTKHRSLLSADKTIEHIVVDPQATHGDSGGGVFRRSDGRQIGVLWGGNAGFTYVNRLKDIRIFLKSLNFDE